MAYQPIEDYGIIGDLHTVALVGKDGSIDFLSFPHFDSPTVFAAILDDEKGGRFRISPILDDRARQKQLYLPDTNILLTRSLSEEGVAEISDFMPLRRMGHQHDIVRRVKTVRGEIRYRMIFEPRFDYARAGHQIEKKDGEVLFISDGKGGAVRLRTSVPVRIENGAAIAEFKLGADESASFIMEEALPQKESPSSAPDYVSDSFKETANFWRRWVARSSYSGRWRDMVNRSALTLKLLVSEEYGSIVAAPTLGLPEKIGGVRNWDYRYTWIRDASFTLYALIRLGYTDEAAAFMKWIEARCAELEPDGSLQVLYGIDGAHDLTEQALPHLEGYCGSRPVRYGNDAFCQLQLDIYGELMDSVYLYDKYGEPISHDLWTNLVRIIDWLCDHWSQPDEGIWETRGGRHEFLYSRVMCWVAFDRAMRLAQKRSLPAPLERWQRQRDAIYGQIFTDFWNDDLQTFVQYRNSRSLDASCLLMPLVRFIGARDPRWLSTMRAVEKSLVSDSLVYRYNLGDQFTDGLPGDEGTFSMCSFWYVECLSRGGDLQKARFYFEKALGYANHLGLFSEELGPRGEHLGNFPQAFTHLGLISAAYDLNRRLSSSSPEQE